MEEIIYNFVNAFVLSLAGLLVLIGLETSVRTFSAIVSRRTVGNGVASKVFVAQFEKMKTPQKTC
jgi:hypothetical protein